MNKSTDDEIILCNIPRTISGCKCYTIPDMAFRIYEFQVSVLNKYLIILIRIITFDEFKIICHLIIAFAATQLNAEVINWCFKMKYRCRNYRCNKFRVILTKTIGVVFSVLSVLEQHLIRPWTAFSIYCIITG